MSEAYIVQIDLARVQANLTKAEGKPVSEADVRAFLTEAGFQETPRGWLAEEVSLDVLGKDEITSIKEL